MAGMAILPLVPWTGAQSMPRGQRIERESHGRRECFTRSQMTPFAITSLESKPSVSTRFCPTRLVGSGYADVSVPMLARMYKKRLAGYAALGYSVITVEDLNL